MRKVPRNSKMWDFLNASGVLVNGTDEQIKSAKKQYRKNYLLEYKRKQRSNSPEFGVYFSKENGEFKMVQRSAMEHKKTIPGFIKASVLAYINKAYIVPDRDQVAKLEELLANCFNEIQAFAKANKTLYWQQYEDIQKRIEKLEREVAEVLRQPKSIEDFIMESVKHNPELRQSLISLLTANSP